MLAGQVVQDPQALHELADAVVGAGGRQHGYNVVGDDTIQRLQPVRVLHDGVVVEGVVDLRDGGGFVAGVDLGLGGRCEGAAEAEQGQREKVSEVHGDESCRIGFGYDNVHLETQCDGASLTRPIHERRNGTAALPGLSN